MCFELHAFYFRFQAFLGIEPDDNRSTWTMILFGVSLGILQVNMICGAI